MKPEDTGIQRNEGAIATPAAGGPETVRSTGRTIPVLLWFSSGLAIALAARLFFFDFESGDYRAWLRPWYDFFIVHGRWHGLGVLTDRVSNYPPLYMYLVSLSTLLPIRELYAIKTLSVVCDYLAAWYVWRLVKRRCGTQIQAYGSALLLLFLPTVVLNSSMWGQCDIMYTTGFLASLFYVLEKRPVAALVAFGISCSLKPQAIFWCPLLAGLFVTRQLPWKLFWIPAAVYVASCLPAIAAGRPPEEVLLHWGRVRDRAGLVHGATPSWYQFIGDSESPLLWLAGVLLALSCTGLLVFSMKRHLDKGALQSGQLVAFALLSVLFPPFFLPGMHQRYFFAADVISLVYAFYFPFGWYAALLVQVASLTAYCPFLFHVTPPYLEVLPILLVIAAGWTIKDLRIRLVTQHDTGVAVGNISA